MKLKILIALFAILCFSISRANSQNSSSVFDLVETDDQKGSQPSGNMPVNSQPTLSQQNPNLILGPPSTFSSNNQASLNNLNDNLTPINQSSLFTQSNSPNNNNNNINFNNNNNNNGNNLQAMLEKIKSKVTNPYLKDNLTVENIANFFANFISGNSFVNNLEVKDIAEFRKVEIKDNLKVKGEAAFEKISFNKIKNRALMITDNEIIFDPEATIKLRNNKIAFKVKDVFEVITFMKYIVKICGSKLEKCDFNNLLKNHNANQIMQIVRTFQKKIDETQKKALEFQEKKVKEEKAKKEEEEKKKENNGNNTNNSNSSNKDAEGKSKNEKNAPAQKNNNTNNSNNTNSNNNISNKNLRGAAANNNHENAHNNNSKSDSNDAKKTADDLITKHFTFKEKDLMDIEKELSHDFMFKQASDSFEDYSKFLENPQIADMMNNYYYSMPSYGLGMNNLMAPPHF